VDRPKAAAIGGSRRDRDGRPGPVLDGPDRRARATDEAADGAVRDAELDLDLAVADGDRLSARGVVVVVARGRRTARGGCTDERPESRRARDSRASRRATEHVASTRLAEPHHVARLELHEVLRREPPLDAVAPVDERRATARGTTTRIGGGGGAVCVVDHDKRTA